MLITPIGFKNVILLYPSMKIEDLKAYWVLDSRGNPTVEVALKVSNKWFTASAPSGASTGKHEALELRDNEKAFHGKGVNKAIENIYKIKEKLLSDFSSPEEFDAFLIELDGTPNKSNIGGNSIVALSIAFFKAFSSSQGKEPWELFYSLSGKKGFPRLMFNVINGGKHSGNGLAIQEFLIVPNHTLTENVEAASEIYIELKSIIKEKYGKIYTSVGDEGGFAPPIKTTQEALELLDKAISSFGYTVDISLDAAADSFFKNGKYFLDGREFSREELVDYYKELNDAYHFLSIEDPFYEEDAEGFKELKNAIDCLIIGDDITVTNPQRIEKYKDYLNGVIIKLNQIGSVSETIKAINTAYSLNLSTVVSHRSGDREDSFISDLAYGVASPFMKSGAPARGERTAKYNRLLRIYHIYEEG